MKKAFIKVMALTLAFIMTLGVAPLGGMIDFDLFGVSVNAASESDLTFALINDGTEYEVSGCNEEASGELIIPSTYNGLPVTSIGDFAFLDNGRINSITIPESIISIENGAFSNCYNLSNVTIRCGLKNIGEYAFFYCTSLTHIDIPLSVTSIGYGAFARCASLEDISVDSINTNYYSQDGVLFSKDKATIICYPKGKKGASYAIPDSVTSIGAGAFDACSLTSITIPKGVTDIGFWAFKDCDGLTSITIPDSVTNVDDYAFADCFHLESVTVSESVKSIGNHAFDGCPSLTDVYYSGTQEEWKDIEIGEYNESLTDAEIHYEWGKEISFFQKVINFFLGILDFFKSLFGFIG